MTSEFNYELTHTPPLKYRLTRPFYAALPLRGWTVRTAAPTVSLDVFGLLRIPSSFEWDGPSGPAVDTPDLLAPSLIHDVLVKMTYVGLLPYSARKPIDRIYYKYARQQGVPFVRAAYHYVVLRLTAWTFYTKAYRKAKQPARKELNHAS